MAPTKLKCEFSECTWTSHEGELDTVVKLMEMHFAAKHQPAPSSSTRTSPTSLRRTPWSSSSTSKSKKIAVKEFLVRDRTEEIDADTHHPPELLQQPLNQEVHRADQRAPAESQEHPQEHCQEHCQEQALVRPLR